MRDVEPGDELKRVYEIVMTGHAYDDENLCFLALSRVRGVGFETLKKFARERISFRTLFRPDGLSSISDKIKNNSKYSKIFDTLSDAQKRVQCIEDGKRVYASLKKRDINIVFLGSEDYPNQLLDLKDVPQWLFVEGNVDVLHKPSITAVGSRKYSDEGQRIARHFGKCIQELKAITISGLAAGIDSIVHEASLEASLPTVAVLGSGVLLDYPSDSHDLRDRILSTSGAIVSEYLPNDTYSARNFVRRNRIQAALGRLTFPVEWKAKSGTTHTVRYAVEMKRPLVFARTRNQPAHDWIPNELRYNAAYFTLPKDSEDFMSYISYNLETERCIPQSMSQPMLL